MNCVGFPYKKHWYNHDVISIYCFTKTSSLYCIKHMTSVKSNAVSLISHFYDAE